MTTNPHSPLNDGHLAEINRALSKNDMIEAQITMAKQAGINVDAQEKQHELNKSRLLAIKRVYFPNS